MTPGRVLALAAVTLLAACNRDSAPTPVISMLPKPKPKAVVPAKHGPTAEELTAGMVEAVSLAKSTVPVGMKFQLSDRPAMGRSMDVVVAVLPEDEADSATLKVSGSDGLQLAAGATSHEIAAIEAGHVYKETFAVTPTTEGVQLLTLTVALKHDESTESRTFSVPLIVAPVAPASSPAPGPGASAAPGKRPGK